MQRNVSQPDTPRDAAACRPGDQGYPIAAGGSAVKFLPNWLSQA
jgi:hypothetical protein